MKIIPLWISEETTKKLMRISLRQNVERLKGTRARGGRNSKLARIHVRGEGVRSRKGCARGERAAAAVVSGGAAERRRRYRCCAGAARAWRGSGGRAGQWRRHGGAVRARRLSGGAGGAVDARARSSGGAASGVGATVR